MEDAILMKSGSVSYDMEILVNLNLFTPDKIGNIRNVRNEFNAIKSNDTGNSACYLEYIAYERELLNNIIDTCHDKAIEQNKMKAEQFIIVKINKLYKESLMLFPTEKQIYESYFQFCKFSKQTSKVTPYMYKFVQLHGEDAQAWITAALWEYKEMKNPEKGRQLFMDAFSRHPKSKELYKALIKAELEEASTLSNQIEAIDSESQQSKALKQIFKTYIHCKTIILDLQFLIDLLEILEVYDFSYTLQNEIVRNMTDFFPADELMWHTLAQRELNGYHVNDVFKTLDGEHPITNGYNMPTDNGIPQLETESTVILPSHTRFTLNQRIELCVKIYYKATQIIQTQKIWTYFINAMIDLNKDNSSKLKYSCLMTAYKSAYNASFLTELQYIRYIEQLKHSPDPDESAHFLASVLERATTVHPTSIILWSMHLKYFILQNNELKVRQKFDAAVKQCGSESLPLWKLYKEYLLIITSIESEKKMEELFVEAINQAEPISSHFQVEYIEWLSFIRGIEYTRYIFYMLTEKFKFAPYALYKKMVEINKQHVIHMLNEEQIDVDNFTETINSYNYTIIKFGKIDIDIWIDYIKFHRDYGDVKQMITLLERAKLELDGSCVDSFLFQYEQLINPKNRG